MSLSTTRKLTLDDIADLRAYERERPALKEHILTLKSRRRVPVGELCTFVFECRDTVRWQIQEMARVEKIITDEGIEAELRTYNPLIPEPGQLSATLFVELTSDALLREWLPKLVGVERAAALDLADGTRVRAVVEEAHDAQLTRDDITSTVHYLRWEFDAAQRAGFARGGVRLVLDHPAYRAATELARATVAELLTDLGA
jgi:hypothetical protein